MVSKYKYIFTFGQGRKSIELLSASMADQWNDIYDLMDAYREMYIERRDRKCFKISEIKKLTHDLIEDMEEDYAEIWLEIEDEGKSLHFLEVNNVGGFDLDELKLMVTSNFMDCGEPISVSATDEFCILLFPDEHKIVLLVVLEDFKALISSKIVNALVSESKKHDANELYIFSYHELADSATNIVDDLKIVFKKPNDLLTDTNEKNLDLAIGEFELTLNSINYSFQADRFSALLELVRYASSNISKKNTLENLANYLFNALKGFKVVCRNYRGPSEEIDLLVANESLDGLLSSLGTPLAIECRHRKTSASSKDVRDFKGKLEDIGLKSGILITLKGVSGSRYDAISVIREARKSGLSIIVLDFNDLLSIGGGKDPIEKIKECYYRFV